MVAERTQSFCFLVYASLDCRANARNDGAEEIYNRAVFFYSLNEKVIYQNID